jgi:GNAT superfamily N-acetyltransferase
LANETELEFRDLRERCDPGLLEAIYRDLFKPNFPDPDEQETPDDWTPRLWGQPKPPQPEQHGFVAGTRLDDPGSHSLAGFVFVERYRASRCALLSYIAVDKDAQGKKIGKTLFEKGCASAVNAATADGAPLRAVFAEIHDPHRVKNDVMDAHDRVRIMAKLGAWLVPIRYVQPALGEVGQRSDRLMLIAFPVDQTHSLDSSVVDEFLCEYYAALGVGAEDSDLKKARAALASAAQPDGTIVLEPLGTSLDFETFGVALHFVAAPRDKPKRKIGAPVEAFLSGYRSFSTVSEVAINGTPRVGTATTLTVGTYDPTPTSRSHQWQIDVSDGYGLADIDGATGMAYTPVERDDGHKLCVVETVARFGCKTGRFTSASAAVGKPNPFASFETDLFSFRYVPDRDPTNRAAVFWSEVVDVPAELSEVTLSLPGKIEYTSEGNVVHLDLPGVLDGEGRRKRLFAVKASRTNFRNSDLSVLHLIFTNVQPSRMETGFGPSELVLDEFDIIALSKLWQGGEDWKARDEIRFRTSKRVEGNGMTVEDLVAQVFGDELTHEARRVRLGTVQLIAKETTRGIPWTEIWDDVETLCGDDERKRPKHELNHHGPVKSLGGVVQGILDFREVDIAELEDVFAAPSVDSDLVGMHKATVLCVIQSDRSYEASAKTIGISPYLLLPQAVLLHNEAVLDEGEGLVETSRGRHSAKQLEDAITKIRELLANYLPNVFHYPQEQELYKAGEVTRDLGFRQAHLKERLDDLEARWAKAVDARRSLAEDLRNSLLLVLALLPIYPFLGYRHQREALGLVILIGALLVVVPRLNSRRRDPKGSA